MRLIKQIKSNEGHILTLKQNIENVYFIFINNEPFWNTLDKNEAEYYFINFIDNKFI